MERALQIAENYAKREKIDLSHYFLYEAKLISYGSEESKKESRWFFWWVSEDGALGKYVQLTVTMDGKVSIIPSM